MVLAALHGVLLKFAIAIPLGLVFAFGKAIRDVRSERRGGG
jgi:hypothetical protein